MTTFLVIFTGILIRLVLPLLMMAIIVSFLRRLDARWQAEAMYHQKFATAKDRERCWEVKGCSAEKIENCPAAKIEEPCWQAFRKENGYLLDDCLHCPIFRSAPVLVPQQHRIAG